MLPAQVHEVENGFPADKWSVSMIESIFFKSETQRYAFEKDKNSLSDTVKGNHFSKWVKAENKIEYN